MKMDQAYYEKLADEFRKSKEAIDALTKRQDAMKKELVQAVKDNGYEDDKGNLWLQLGEKELKYERRVSRALNADAAEQWAREQGIWDDIKEVVERLSEEKLLGYSWLHKEVEETIQGFYAEKESWAFKA
jgi:hypothetical protein